MLVISEGRNIYKVPASISSSDLLKLSQFSNDDYVLVDGRWQHRSLLKCIVNPILRLLQYKRNDPYVIATLTDFVYGYPVFVKYTFQRVSYTKT